MSGHESEHLLRVKVLAREVLAAGVFLPAQKLVRHQASWLEKLLPPC